MTIAKLIDELVRIMGYEVRIFTDTGDWYVDVCQGVGGPFLFQNWSVDLTLALQGAWNEMKRRAATDE